MKFVKNHPKIIGNNENNNEKIQDKRQEVGTTKLHLDKLVYRSGSEITWGPFVFALLLVLKWLIFLLNWSTQK